MNNTFTFEKKKKLADKISKLKKKEDLIKVLEIIYEYDQNITETQNGSLVMFNNLSDAAYHKLDLYLKSITKKNTSPTSDTTSEKKEYVSPIKSDFPEQEQFNPKLRYNNKEKNIIKRHRYEKMLSSEKESDDNIVYKTFEGPTLSDSNSETNKIELVPKGKKKTVARQKKKNEEKK